MHAKRLSILKRATHEYKDHVPGQLLFSSVHHDWNNLLISDYLMPDLLPGGPAPAIPDYSLGLIYSGSFAGECSVQSDSWREQDMQTGQMCFLPPENEINWHWWPLKDDKPLKLVIAHLSAGLVRKMAGETFGVNPDRIEINTSLIIKDSLLQQLILAAMNEAERGNPCGPLYGETAAQMMALHLLSKYSGLRLQSMHLRQGLPPRQLRKVFEYIDVHLDCDISLGDLGRLTGMSNYHFLRMFKRSMGLTPLQYIIRRRMEVAKELLTKTKLTVTEVAFETGYESLGHFIGLFKRYYGVTPATFRRML